MADHHGSPPRLGALLEANQESRGARASARDLDAGQEDTEVRITTNIEIRAALGRVPARALRFLVLHAAGYRYHQIAELEASQLAPSNASSRSAGPSSPQAATAHRAAEGGEQRALRPIRGKTLL